MTRPKPPKTRPRTPSRPSNTDPTTLRPHPCNHPSRHSNSQTAIQATVHQHGPAECAERLNPPPPTGVPGVLDVSSGTPGTEFRPAPHTPPGLQRSMPKSIKNRIQNRLQILIRFLIDFGPILPPFWAPFSLILAQFCLPNRYQNRFRFLTRLKIDLRSNFGRLRNPTNPKNIDFPAGKLMFFESYLLSLPTPVGTDFVLILTPFSTLLASLWHLFRFKMLF